MQDLAEQFFLSHFPLDKMATISQFKGIFFFEKIWISNKNFMEIFSLGSNWQYVSIGSDNGLAPSRRQAIIWTNVDPVYRRIYAALGGGELMTEFVSISWI